MQSRAAAYFMVYRGMEIDGYHILANRWNGTILVLFMKMFKFISGFMLIRKKLWNYNELMNWIDFSTIVTKNCCVISYTMILWSCENLRLLHPVAMSFILFYFILFFYRKNYSCSIVNEIIWHSPTWHRCTNRNIYTDIMKHAAHKPVFMFTSRDGQWTHTHQTNTHTHTHTHTHTIHKHADWGAGVLLLEGEWEVWRTWRGR